VKALEVSLGDDFERIVLKGHVRDNPFETAIFVLEGLHLGHIADFHAAKLRFPFVKRCGADAVLAAELVGVRAGVGLLDDTDDLRLGEPGLTHLGDSLRSFWPGIRPFRWDTILGSGQLFKPFEDLLVEAVVAASAARVLDTGCGTGSTTLALARRLGSNGRCVGIDISDAMIAAARDRAERSGTSASFIRADAQVHAFEPASFDMIISRFGVMFFADSIRAFASLWRAARDNAALRFIAWRSAAENPFMTTAERAAAPLFPNIPARHPGAPGQFAFADQHHVSGILKASGWAEIDIQPIDVACTMPEKELVNGPPLIPMCTETTCILTPPAGWSALRHRLHPPRYRRLRQRRARIFRLTLW
jgi:ubiquinone/menaquinone biosynthesis C-methylase UbiE